MVHQPEPLIDAARVAELAAHIEKVGAFALDLEFVSEARYVPELALIQVAWGAAEDPEVVLVDPLLAEVRPLVELVASEGVATVLHAAQGDLSLLAARYGIEARAVFDTQLAAALLGLGDQLGYAALVEALLGIRLDKDWQWTRWLDRPLAAEQLRYAVDDVRFLPRLSWELRARLAAAGRLAWAEEESARLARAAARRLRPEEAFRKVGGWQRLRPRQLGALRALAEWREREALARNRPPSWIAKDRVLLDLARRQTGARKDLLAVDGLGPRSVERHGRALLAAIRRGRASPVAPEAPPRLPTSARAWVADLLARLQQVAREAGVPPRLLASRAEVEALVAWRLTGDPAREPDLPLLAGWRRQVAGEAALAWLAIPP
jgi:ribonuclease D